MPLRYDMPRQRRALRTMRAGAADIRAERARERVDAR